MNLLPIIVASGILLIVLALYDNPVYRRLAPIAFILHLGVGLFLVPRLPYRWDISNYHTAAMALFQGSLPESSGSTASFGAFQAVFYYIFEPVVEVMTVFNSLLAVLIPIPAYYLARNLYPSAVSSSVGRVRPLSDTSVEGITVLILFLPAPFLFMTLPMRDTLSTLLLFTILALIVVALSKRHIWPLTLATPLFGMLFLIRSELGAILVLGIGATVIVQFINAIMRRSISFPTLVAVLSPIGIAGFLLFTEMYPVDRLETMRDYRARGGAAYLDWMGYDTWIDVIVVAPVRAIYFQYAPFPTQIESVFQLLGMVGLPLSILLTVAAYRSFMRCRLDQRVFALLITVYLTGIIGYGLINSNFGTTIRHRVPFEYMLVVFAAPAIERWSVSFMKWRRQWPRYYSDNKKHRNES